MDFKPLNPEFFDWRGDVLLLAGDLAEEAHLCKQKGFWEKVSQMADQVLVIAGNHEHYRGAIDKTHKHVSAAISGHRNICFMEDAFFHLDSVIVFGSTFWSDLSNPLSALHVEGGLNDYKQIRVAARNYSRLRTHDTNSRHQKSKYILDEILNKNADTDFVVMTHHAPSFQSIHPDFKSDHRNAGYATELYDWVANRKNIKAWVHGHIHYKFDYMIEQCRVMCNARGYPNERPSFLPPYQPFDFEV
jgi:predicted phosphohydrolase